MVYFFSLQRHIKVFHNTERPHKCETCEKTFKTAKDLKVSVKFKSPFYEAFSRGSLFVATPSDMIFVPVGL